MVTAIDYHNKAASQIFELYINKPPEFDYPLLQILRIRVGSISKFKLPLTNEGSFKVKHKEIPMFARIENIIYTLKPTTQAFLGIHKVKG